MRWILVDKLLQCEPGKSAVGVKAFSRCDMLFVDHFPGYPVVPGVLQVEMIAHTGSRCIALVDHKNLAILGSIRSAKFFKPIEPGSQCVIKVNIDTLRANYAIASGEIEVDGERTCSVEIMFAMIPRTKLATNKPEDEVLADWRRRNPVLNAESPVTSPSLENLS